MIDSSQAPVDSTGFRPGGLKIMTTGCQIKGIQFQRFETWAISINGSDNVLSGDIFGGVAPEDGDGVGVEVASGSNNRIGGSSAADQDLFRFGTVGAFLHASADSTIVQGSLFGLAADGTMPAGNAVGLFLYGAMNTTASENTFSANNTGMLLAGGATSTKIQDNHFGFGADWLTVLAILAPF